MMRLELLQNVELPSTGIVPASTFDTYVQSADIIAQTRSWAQKQQSKAIKETEKAIAEARQQGYAKGIHEGFRKFEAAARSFQQDRKDMQERIKETLQACLLHVLKNLPPTEVFKAIVAAVMQNIPDDDPIVIAVHPDNISKFSAAIEAYTKENPTAVPIKLEGTLEIPLGECIIYTPKEIINAGISTMVEQMTTAITPQLEVITNKGLGQNHESQRINNV